jgi:hypothetical protein
MKKTIGWLVVCALVVAWVAPAVWAEGEAEAPKAAPAKDAAAKVKPALDEISVSGTLEKAEKTVKGKDGAEKAVTVYSLKTADGSVVSLPPIPAAAAKAGAAALNYDTFVGKTVEIKGMGKVMDKAGQKETKLMKVTSIVEQAAAAAAE